MQHLGVSPSRHGVDALGLDPARIYWHLSPAELYEQAISRREGALAAEGPFVACTGKHTGRSPNDKFMVRNGASDDVSWGDVNRPLEPACFDALLERMRRHLRDRDLFVFDGYAGADPSYRLPVRVVTETAWHNLFASNMFLRERDHETLRGFEPRYTVVDAPSCVADPDEHGTDSPTFIVVDLSRELVLIGGTAYAGEIKKSIFSVMNYLLPKADVLSMHCSCNYGRDRDDVALFFGLSGTGKTTLSAASDRTLIGDDEHGWSGDGVFNIEGGCYAKVICLSRSGEPEIWKASRRFGAILENVVLDDESREIDFDDESITENTRASYPVRHLENIDPEGRAGHPRHVVFLTCDAFGVLPPISRLSRDQAMYHFLSGYTAKVAGTERGVTEPKATFSACFGAPFLPLHPGCYAEMLGERLERHGSEVWLVNTGWTGGPHGVGRRIDLGFTRKMVAAALGDELEETSYRRDPVFGVEVPERIDGVPDEVLRPKTTWSDPAVYDAQAEKLARMFRENFAEYAGQLPSDVVEAGP